MAILESTLASSVIMGGDRDGGDDASTRIQRALQAVRSHLGLQVAYVSRFEGNEAVFREVDAPGLETRIKAGDTRSLDDIYCRHILEGRLPQLIPDTAAEPFCATLPITKASGIGAHLSVPIMRGDGTPYGMFCCMGFQADRSLNTRDLQTMKAFAEIASFEINKEIGEQDALSVKRGRIENLIERDEFSIAYQPIWDLATMMPVGFECLSRFAPMPYQSPDKWFAQAEEVGLGVELELAAIHKALAALTGLPAHLYLSINASPDVLLSGRFERVMQGVPLHRVLLEITEHACISNYEELLKALTPLRTRGLRLAIDDAGAGYSSLRHILNMAPDYIKLDMGLTQNIDLDPARKALARSLVGFCRETGSRIIAEGVERQSELRILRSIGVNRVQGYLLGRPSSLEHAVELTAGRVHAGEKVAV